MTRRTLVIVIAAACALAGCGASTGSVDGPRLEAFDTALTRRCDDPVALPHRDLTEVETVRAWGADRKALKDCGRRQAALIAAVATRDALVSGRAPMPIAP